MYSYSEIRAVHLEISTRCNAGCPGCPRNMGGVDIVDDYPIHDMTLAEAQTIFQPSFLQQLKSININGNLGDFVTARDALKIVEYFLKQNPKLYLTISTNASAKPAIWEPLGKLNVTVFFRIDGLEDTHQLYRQYTDYNFILKNAQKFIAAGGNAIWTMIKFDHNLHQIEECRKLSEQLGFKRFELVDHGRNQFSVFNRNREFSHDIGENIEPKNWEEKVAWWEGSRRNNLIDPVVEPKPIKCQVKRSKSLYVSATGEIYPCCWLGFYPRVMNHTGNPGIKRLLPENNNAIEVGIEQAISWFDRVEQTWNDQHQIYACNTTCGVTE